MGFSLLQKPLWSVPAGVEPRRYYLCLFAPLALGASAGMQATMTAFLAWGPAADKASVEQLTKLGQDVVRPEHDLLIYLAGALFSLVCAFVMMWWWRGKLADSEPSRAREFMYSSALLLGFLAVASVAVYGLLLASDWFSRDFRFVKTGIRPPTRDLAAIRLLVPCALALVCAAVDLEYSLWRPAESASDAKPGRLRLGKLLRYVMPVFVILVVGVPPGVWSALAGFFFHADLCHHLHFFMMGPALSFAHGKAFGTEIYSQYGIGWPLLAATLSHFCALTYGNLIGISIVYACVYYVALFFLLRACFKQEIWAAAAVVLAICWQIFSGMAPTHIVWRFPSSTMMRTPMDVWFFLALVMHQRSRRILWAGLAGVASALGVFFGTETGVYLVLTFLFYSLLQAGLAPQEDRPVGRRWMLAPAAFCAAGGATLLASLLYGSRGTLLSAAFWRGWVEAFVIFAGQGVSALPIAELPDAPLVFFMFMVMAYLVVVVYAVARCLHGSASRNEVLLAALAAYGLALLLVFVNRSHPFNLCHATPPFAVLVTALILGGWNKLPAMARHSAFPCLLAGGVVLLLVTKRQFLSYPSLLRSPFQPAPPAGLALRLNPVDVSSLPPEYEEFAREVHNIGSAIQTLAPDGKDVAILDLNDVTLYSVADARPWSRYAPLFYMAITRQSLETIRNDLITQLPKEVVIRGQNAARPAEWEFLWGPLYEAVSNRYVLYEAVGPYEVWVHPHGGLSHCRLAEDAQAKGQVAEAVAHYKEALRLEPDLPVALNNLAWIRAAQPEARFRDGAEAVRLAERACHATGYKQALLMGTLAAAYAEAGRFDEAAAMAEKAQALALSAGQNESGEKDQQLLELFKARQPYREPAAAAREQ